MNTVIIIGGGLAGLTCAILLQRKGFLVTVFEKKKYPFHRVCGEYISNEARPFLESLGVSLSKEGASKINCLSVTSESGKKLLTDLPMGGFGLSRYKLDDLLFQQAERLGVEFVFEKVAGLKFNGEYFEISASNKVHESSIGIAAFGKRSNLDQKLKRDFFYKRSPYLGVKYHIKTDLPDNLIRLDNFQGGYSGVCKIEGDKFNLCYLSETANLKKYKDIPEMEENVLYKNPSLKHLFKNSEFISKNPEVINEISFERKTLVEDHLLFCGDSAGMITPLCGNGMAIAFHSAKILAENIIAFGSNKIIDRAGLEQNYKYEWTRHFALRLKTGRMIQRLFGNSLISGLSIQTLNRSSSLTKFMVERTHGKVF